MQREKMPKIKALRLATQMIGLAPNQCFYRTPKAYEIWQEKPLFRIKRISRKMSFGL